MLLIGNGTLITHNAQNPLVEDGCVVTDGAKIIDFGTTARIKSLYNGDFIDASNKIIMPAFINTHAHFYSAMARGMPSLSAQPSKNFGEILQNLWWKLDKGLTMDEVRYSALIAGMECIRNGVVTVFDHHASYGAIGGSLQTIADAVFPLGLRTSLCFEVSERNGKKDFAESMQENVRFMQNVQKKYGNRFSALFGLHAPFTLSDSALDECAQAVRTIHAHNSGFSGGFHVHAAEGLDDVIDSKSKGYAGAVERLYKHGILGKNTIAVHCIHITEAEEDLLRQTDTAVVTNPQSNMGNAVGCAKIPELMAKGVLVGLGTDGYTSDMLASMKTANILHKHRLVDPSVMWAEPPKMLFQNNRLIAERHFNQQIGIIAQNAAADIITVNYIPPTPLTKDNFASHVHFGLQGSDVNDVIANGNLVMKNRTITVLDEAQILAKAREHSKTLWNRLVKN